VSGVCVSMSINVYTLRLCIKRSIEIYDCYLIYSIKNISRQKWFTKSSKLIKIDINLNLS